MNTIFDNPLISLDVRKSIFRNNSSRCESSCADKSAECEPDCAVKGLYVNFESQYTLHGLPKLLRLQNTGLHLETLYRGEPSENNDYRKNSSILIYRPYSFILFWRVRRLIPSILAAFVRFWLVLFKASIIICFSVI